MKVKVAYSETLKGYHITDIDCSSCTATGCQCDGINHDILFIFDKDERAKARLGLPDFLASRVVEEMEWRVPLGHNKKDKEDKEGS